MAEANECHSVLNLRGMPPLTRVLSHPSGLIVECGRSKNDKAALLIGRWDRNSSLRWRKVSASHSFCIAIFVNIHARNLSLSCPWVSLLSHRSVRPSIYYTHLSERPTGSMMLKGKQPSLQPNGPFCQAFLCSFSTHQHC